MTFLGPEIKIFLILLGAIYFSICFLNVKLGLVFMTIAMIFSPELPVANLGLRALTIRIEDVLIPILFLAWLARLAAKRDRELITSTPINKLIFAILAMDVISTIWGTTAGAYPFKLSAVFYFLKTVEFFIIFFLVVNYINTRSQIKFFLFFALLTVTLLGLYAMSQIPKNEVFSDYRVTAPFEGTPEPATIGGYMAFLLLIIACLFLYEPRPLMKWFYGIIGIIIFIPFLFTLNRASYIAFIIGMIYITIVSRKKWFGFFLALFLLTSPVWAPDSLKQRIAYTWEDAVNPGREWGVDQSTQERINTYRKMWNTLKYSPIIGCGLGSYDFLDSQYARTLHEIGAVGLGIWLFLYFRLFRISQWLFRNLEEGMFKGMALGYSAGVIGILLHGFGNITFYIVRIMEPFWLISGLVVSLYLQRASEVSGELEAAQEAEGFVSETAGV